jgi:hypothetical protein
MSLYGLAVKRNKKGRHEEALEALLKASEILKSVPDDSLAPDVLSLYVSVSQFISLLGAKLGRPGIELDTVARGLRVWATQVAENPKLRTVNGLVEWERWARQVVLQGQGPDRS